MGLIKAALPIATGTAGLAAGAGLGLALGSMEEDALRTPSEERSNTDYADMLGVAALLIVAMAVTAAAAHLLRHKPPVAAAIGAAGVGVIGAPLIAYPEREPDPTANW